MTLPKKMTARQKALLDEFAASGDGQTIDEMTEAQRVRFLKKVKEMFDAPPSDGESPNANTATSHSDEGIESTTNHGHSYLYAILREFRLSLQAQRDHLSDLTVIIDHLETALGRLSNH